ncbi:MAG: hypothetical protein ACT4OF_01075, partial [Caulobacteraceae bacterium]
PRITLDEQGVRAAISYSLPSPFRSFVREHAFLAAAITFAVVGLTAMALGGLALSVELGRSGWPIALSLVPVALPAAAAAVLVYVALKRF